MLKIEIHLFWVLLSPTTLVFSIITSLWPQYRTVEPFDPPTQNIRNIVNVCKLVVRSQNTILSISPRISLPLSLHKKIITLPHFIT